ncbi:MAG: hypothetical protein JXA91_03300 [Candidatus Thermoplasmatota archaeon]|nr:hypothetical protein [Candidatus Thermoplasmatota archaeon]
MKRKYYFIIGMMLVSTSIFAVQILAHPPQGMVLDYNLETSTLNVTITHSTPGPTLHYINKIEVRLNTNLVLSQDYSSQPTTSQFTYSYNMEAEAGDEIEVTAYCNIQGLIKKSITVKDPAQDYPPEVQIVNPVKGYFHFSGIRLIPTSFDLIADTMSLGGFRLAPLQILATDDVDERKDIEVTIYLNEEKFGIAQFNNVNGYHELKWTGIGLGIYNVKVTAEDSSGNINEDQLPVWYFCFIP